MTSSKTAQRFELSDEQRVSWLQLIRSENVGPATFRDLINHFGTASQALEAIPELARRGKAAARIKVCSRDMAERELMAAKQINARFIGMGEPDYPNALRQLAQAPPLICVRGSLDILKRDCIGIVGSRNSSITGMKLASRFAHGLGEEGYVVVSGLARGIDAAAHKAALSRGTIAVFGGGVDVIFPPENEQLAKDILDNGGAIMSEMPLGWKPRAKDFPRRNRIVTGLSLGVLVVEAARRSGSLITARLANEAGRLVFAVPGSPLDPRSEGTNHLLREGAQLAATVEDIITAINPLVEDKDNRQRLMENEETLYEDAERGVSLNDMHTDDALREQIIGSLGPSPVLIDEIVQFSGASVSQVQLVIIELELAGRIERHGSGQVSLISG